MIPRQINWSDEEIMLWMVARELELLNKSISTVTTTTTLAP